MNGYREWFQDQARDLVMWGIGEAEETSGIPLWNNVINSASHDIKEYITEQLETEFLQRHPEAIEYPEVVNMSHQIMYPTEKKTLQEFWTGWENNLERAKENRSWFHDEMAKKPYEAPRWQEPTKAVDAIDFNITRPEVPDKHKAHPLVYGEEYIDTAKPVTIESEDPERINFSAEPRPIPDIPKDVALDKDSIHIVKKGDVLSKIAKKYGVSVNDIMKENNIKHQDRIYPDQEIRIPSRGNISGEQRLPTYTPEEIENFADSVANDTTLRLKDESRLKFDNKHKDLYKAMIYAESNFGRFNFNPESNAIGPAQLTGIAIKDLKERSKYKNEESLKNDVRTNLKGGWWLLQDQGLKVPIGNNGKKLERYSHREYMPFDYALIAYNAGRATAKSWLDAVSKKRKDEARINYDDPTIGSDDWVSDDLWHAANVDALNRSKPFKPDDVDLLFKAIQKQSLYNTRDKALAKLNEILIYIKNARGYYENINRGNQ